MKNKPWFLFIDIDDKKCKICNGGKIEMNEYVQDEYYMCI